MRRVVLVGALALALVAGASARTAVAGCAACASATEVSLPMDDGVSLAATLYLPGGTPPQGGWPAVLLLHGLGGTRASMAQNASGVLAPHGYAVLAYDARGHGQSGGFVSLDGPREVSDVRAVFHWMAARPDVSDAQIGALGKSYGGGAILRAAVEGVPFKALVPAITWTDLYAALLPQNHAKSGGVASFLQSVQRWDPGIYALAQDALASRNLDELKAFAAERSSLKGLQNLETPTFFIQGRRDFAFDISQALNGYRAVRGPKRLYIGNLGHAPASNPPAEEPHYLDEARLWFDRWLKNEPNGIDTRPRVEVAPDPWTGTTYSYASPPPTTTLTLKLSGKNTIGKSGKVMRMVTLPSRRLEAFGSASLRVSLASKTGWPHLVGVLSAVTPAGREIVISDGGVATPQLTGRPRTVTIRFIDAAALIPARSRLRLTLANASTAQNAQNALYLDIGTPAPARITVGAATLRLPVLRKTISR